jgi:glycosyltransferase involved in cell wall biosynthesis
VTSESEGLSIAILEAMAEGKPVIGSNVGGNSRLVIDNVTGVLYPFGDIVKLQSAIMKYVNNEDLLYFHGKQALKHVTNNFSINSAMKKYESLYNEDN